jgi:hypothetical protein
MKEEQIEDGIDYYISERQEEIENSSIEIEEYEDEIKLYESELQNKNSVLTEKLIKSHIEGNKNLIRANLQGIKEIQTEIDYLNEVLQK